MYILLSKTETMYNMNFNYVTKSLKKIIFHSNYQINTLGAGKYIRKYETFFTKVNCW